MLEGDRGLVGGETVLALAFKERGLRGGGGDRGCGGGGGGDDVTSTKRSPDQMESGVGLRHPFCFCCFFLAAFSFSNCWALRLATRWTVSSISDKEKSSSFKGT